MHSKRPQHHRSATAVMGPHWRDKCLQYIYCIGAVLMWYLFVVFVIYCISWGIENEFEFWVSRVLEKKISNDQKIVFVNLTQT